MILVELNKSSNNPRKTTFSQSSLILPVKKQTRFGANLQHRLYVCRHVHHHTCYVFQRVFNFSLCFSSPYRFYLSSLEVMRQTSSFFFSNAASSRVFSLGIVFVISRAASYIIFSFAHHFWTTSWFVFYPNAFDVVFFFLVGGAWILF